MGQPLTQQVQQEIKAEPAAVTSAFVQTGDVFFSHFNQMINYVNSFGFDRNIFLERLEQTVKEGGYIDFPTQGKVE